MRTDFFVYVFFRPDTGIPFYIGKGTGHRIKKHFCDSGHGQNPHKDRVIAQYKSRGLEIPIIKIRDGLTEPDALGIESALIRAIGCQPDGPLTNMTDGGGGVSGYRHTPETILAMKGKPKSEETKKKLSDALRGKPLSEERKAGLRGIKRPPRSQSHRDNLAISSRGKRHSDETKKRLAELRFGTVASPETKEKMSAAKLGRPSPAKGYRWTEEQKQKLKQRRQSASASNKEN